MSEPLRTLPDGSPCWCPELASTEHTPKCNTLRTYWAQDHAAASVGELDATARGIAQAKLLRQLAFLQSFARLGIIGPAAAEAGVHRSTVNDWCRADPVFVERMAQAAEEAADALEREARRRAIEGWSEPVYQGGQMVGEVTRYSDKMLELMIKGRRPQVFRERITAEVQHSGEIGVSSATAGMQDHEKIALRRILEEAIAAQEAVEAAQASASSASSDSEGG